MTHYLDELAAPPTDRLSPDTRERLVWDLNFAAAAHERANVPYRADAGRLAAAITELTDFAARIQQRATRYQHADRSSRP
jgi:hypothetical protein